MSYPESDFSELNFIVSDAEYRKGAVVSARAFYKLLEDKRKEYGAISDVANNCLLTLQEQYLNNFDKYLEREIRIDKEGIIF